MADGRVAATLKGLGYLVSIASVLLLGAVTWSATQGSPRLRLRLCLIAGMLSSIIGMAFRWYAFTLEQRQKRQENALR